MKLLIIIVQKEDAQNLIGALNANNIMCTKLSSTGGFLRRGNTTFLVGIEDELVDNTLLVIEKACKKRKSLVKSLPNTNALNIANILQGVEIEIGGANAFIVNIQSMIKL